MVEPFHKIAPDALTVGFHVPELSLSHVDDEGTSRYEVAIPENAKLLTCALFICEPQFDVAVLDLDVGRMVRYDRCAIRDKTLRTIGHEGQDAWSLTLVDLLPTQLSCDEPGLRAQNPEYPVVTDLALGCWALGEIQPVAATRMLKLSLSELPTFGQIPVLSCDVTEGSLDGSYCYLHTGLGRCDGNMCKPAEVDMPSNGMMHTTADPRSDGGVASFQARRDSATPIAVCDEGHRGAVCVRADVEAIGQCAERDCVPRGVISFELPLVVSSCNPDSTPGPDGVSTASSSSNFDTDGLNCFPSSIGSMGTCVDGRCRARCATSDDCRAHADSAWLSDAGAGDLRCKTGVSGSALGVCTEAP